MTAAPDFATPIVGWRTWFVVDRGDELRLGSVVQPTLWEPRQELVGECLGRRRWLWFLGRRRHTTHDNAPDASCSCGIYAVRDTALAGQYLLTAEFDRRHVVARVIGLVSLWGRVLACPHGWRAEFAYPARIYVPVAADDVGDPTREEELAASLAEYGVPVELVAHRGEPDLMRSLATSSLA